MHFFKNHHQVREEEHDFSKGSVAGIILRLALPLIVAQFINVLYNIVDRIYIGRIPGASSAALTGVGVAFPVITAITAFSNLVGTGGPPLCSIARGKGDEERAEGIMGTSFTITLITGGILILVGMAVKEPLLYALGASDATFGYADDYISIYLLGTVFVMISLSMNGFINCQGFARTGMFTVLIGAVINIVLDPVFIFGFGMGVKGAALSGTIGMFMGSAIGLVYLFRYARRLRPCRLKWSLKSLRLSLRNVGYQCRIGSSALLTEATMAMLMFMGNHVFMKYLGDDGVGAFGIACYYMPFVFMVGNAIAQSAQPIISYNFGLGSLERVRATERIALLTAVACGVVITVLFVFFPHVLVGLFIRLDNPAAHLAVDGFPWFSAAFIFFILNLAVIGYYQSIERVKPATLLALLRGFIFLVPSFILLPKALGTHGIWLALCLSEVLTTVVIALACMAGRPRQQAQG